MAGIHNTHLSITHVLPVKILALIFKYCKQISYRQSPCHVTLSAVCKHWHQIAIGTANLWTDIYYRPQEGDKDARPDLDSCLNRSQCAPLDIRIGGKCMLFPVLKLISNHMHHFRSLEASTRDERDPGLELVHSSLAPAVLELCSQRSVYLPSPIPRCYTAPLYSRLS